MDCVHTVKCLLPEMKIGDGSLALTRGESFVAIEKCLWLEMPVGLCLQPMISGLAARFGGHIHNQGKLHWKTAVEKVHWKSQREFRTYHGNLLAICWAIERCSCQRQCQLKRGGPASAHTW